ncbi:MAG: hypothetical protein SVZ03_00120 [Spirochaetota bacterium]|nr:hypothetical protein [Spirochaetota bacterium]
MLGKVGRGAILIVLISLLIFQTNNSYSKDIPFKLIEIEKVSRYHENRIAFQHIQRQISDDFDDSISCLLIIKDDRMYLLRDGYDDANVIRTTRYLLELERKVYDSLWVNLIDKKPDYIRITDRRVELMINTNKDFVSKNFGNFYANVRNSFIQKHVNVFRRLLNNRSEAGLHIERNPIQKSLFVGASDAETKYALAVSGKTLNDTVYFAEDADGDGFTETFTVDLVDGFHWGFKSGPNILFIYNNKEEDIKQIIGKLVHEAYYGTSDEEKNILANFPKDEDIISEFKLDKVAQVSGISEQ